MESIFRSRGLLILLALALIVASSSCSSGPDRKTQVALKGNDFETLLPGGRVYSNDLGVDDPDRGTSTTFDQIEIGLLYTVLGVAMLDLDKKFEAL